MTTATPEKLFEAEVKQADIDHHTPTAGAMTGHIVANLEVLSNKLQMAKWYVKGMSAQQLKVLFGDLLRSCLRSLLTSKQDPYKGHSNHDFTGI